ncbi:MAG: GGDEF domain-containing protein [Eubacteriales bacterium]|nr:GGDEF domain-containing protein [Eubacteriales bacterium]
MTNETKQRQISICVMIGDVSYDFSTELMKSILDTARREGVQVLYMMGMPRHAEPVEPGSELKTAYHHNSVYDYACLFGADAYILSCGSLSGFESEDTYLKFLERFEKTPSVVLQEHIETEQPGKSCITVNNYSSFCQCIEHLIVMHRCRKIAFLAGVKGHPDTKERMRAYLDTMHKYDLPVTDSMIVYGDFSEFSDALVMQLLDCNPGLDAIAFCNDEMARGGYRVCAKRGLRIGKDIAFTGFDNFTTSRALMPPLTTVSQNIYRMGEIAVLQAIDHVHGKHVESVRLETKLLIRRSCGCSPDTVLRLFEPDEYGKDISIDEVMRNIAADLRECYAESGQERGDRMIDRFIGYIMELVRNEERIVDKYQMSEWLQTFVEEFSGSTHILAMRLNDYMIQMPPFSLWMPPVRKLYDILGFSQGFLFSYKARMVEKTLDDFRAQSWFIPELIRDLVDSDIGDEDVFLNVVRRLNGIGLNYIYICLLPEAQPLNNPNLRKIPDQLFLAAYHSADAVRSYPRAEMPVIDAKHPLRNLPDLKSTTHLMSFSIFSGNIQYGMLLCEVNMGKSSLLHVVGLQLGILINFLDLKQKEKIIGSQLENILERNQILNFLSEYDPLCNILNRRGFIEQAIHLNREHDGRSAICVFMDLDHLKEINDTFGHSEGDAALTAFSDILKQTVRREDLIARVGGDEFVGMFIIDQPDFGQTFRIRIRQAFETFNESSNRPYYVEASIGIAFFTCNHSIEIGKIVSEADQYLYAEKKERRPSAVRKHWKGSA